MVSPFRHEVVEIASASAGESVQRRSTWYTLLVMMERRQVVGTVEWGIQVLVLGEHEKRHGGLQSRCGKAEEIKPM